MPVIQRVEHPAEDIEELVVTGLTCDPGPVGVVLLLPVDLPQLEKWIPVVKGLPQLLEILLGIAIAHGTADPSSAVLASPASNGVSSSPRQSRGSGSGSAQKTKSPTCRSRSCSSRVFPSSTLFWLIAAETSRFTSSSERRESRRPRAPVATPACRARRSPPVPGLSERAPLGGTQRKRPKGVVSAARPRLLG